VKHRASIEPDRSKIEWGKKVEWQDWLFKAKVLTYRGEKLKGKKGTVKEG